MVHLNIFLKNIIYIKILSAIYFEIVSTDIIFTKIYLKITEINTVNKMKTIGKLKKNNFLIHFLKNNYFNLKFTSFDDLNFKKLFSVDFSLICIIKFLKK